MNTIAVLFLCFQACLVQQVFGVCPGRFAPAIEPLAPIAPGIAPFGYGPELAYPAGYPYGYGPEIVAPLAPYGGIGEGNVAVAGELPVVGNTAVVGQVPIMGAVRFAGDVAAAGSVSIVGRCSCGFDEFLPSYY